MKKIFIIALVAYISCIIGMEQPSEDDQVTIYFDGSRQTKQVSKKLLEHSELVKNSTQDCNTPNTVTLFPKQVPIAHKKNIDALIPYLHHVDLIITASTKQEKREQRELLLERLQKLREKKLVTLASLADYLLLPELPHQATRIFAQRLPTPRAEDFLKESYNRYHVSPSLTQKIASHHIEPIVRQISAAGVSSPSQSFSSCADKIISAYQDSQGNLSLLVELSVPGIQPLVPGIQALKLAVDSLGQLSVNQHNVNVPSTVRIIAHTDTILAICVGNNVTLGSNAGAWPQQVLDHGHGRSISNVQFSHDGKILAISGKHLTRVAEQNRNGHWVFVVTFDRFFEEPWQQLSPTGKKLFFFDYGKSSEIRYYQRGVDGWDLMPRSIDAKLSRITALAVTDDERLLAVGSITGRIRILEMSKVGNTYEYFQLIDTLKSDRFAINKLLFNREGTLLCAVSACGIEVFGRKSILQQFELINVLDRNPSYWISFLALIDDEKKLISHRENDAIKVWDLYPQAAQDLVKNTTLERAALIAHLSENPDQVIDGGIESALVDHFTDQQIAVLDNLIIPKYEPYSSKPINMPKLLLLGMIFLAHLFNTTEPSFGGTCPVPVANSEIILACPAPVSNSETIFESYMTARTIDEHKIKVQMDDYRATTQPLLKTNSSE